MIKSITVAVVGLALVAGLSVSLESRAVAADEPVQNISVLEHRFAGYGPCGGYCKRAGEDKTWKCGKYSRPNFLDDGGCVCKSDPVCQS